jgi:hypothetical protein
VLIVDVVHSTALYERIGNVEARAAVGGCLAKLSGVVAKFHGRVVKSMGDGLLCTFPGATEAVRAALEMLKPAAQHELRLRIGVDAGEVLEQSDDIFGDVVNTASRIANLSKPDEILVSRKVRNGLPRFIQAMLNGVQPIMVKGKSAPLELYSLLESPQPGTMMGFSVADDAREVTSLVLSYGGATHTVDAGHGQVRMGREPGNDLVVTHQYASRHHARVYYKGGKFILVDESANGTYLEPSGQRPIALRREEGLLLGSGRIHLGFDPDKSEAEAVVYRVERGGRPSPVASPRRD